MLKICLDCFNCFDLFNYQNAYDYEFGGIYGIKIPLAEGSSYTYNDFQLLDQGHPILGKRLCVYVNRKEEKALNSFQRNMAQI